MPTVREIEEALFEAAPGGLAMDWDNVGHLVGFPEGEVNRVLAALDVTPAVVEEAIATGAELIVAHHPVMNVRWHEQEMQTLRTDTRLGSLLIRMIQSGVSAICMHTNLDAAQGGVNDMLAQALELENIRPLGDDGIGRVGDLPESMALPDFLAHVRDKLGPNGIRYSRAGWEVRTVAVGGGACGDYFRCALDRGADAFVTADVKYDQFLDARALGLTLIDAGHFPTEDVVIPAVVDYLREKFPGLEVEKSSSHREVIEYYV